ncbi:MAG: pyruvate kinase [Verrucomicrobia bacterium]|nr:pyruvate kinase [Verrucomicrobiota bacterium]
MNPQGFRKTRIIATLGPASESPDMLERLILAGVNVLRLNMSHAKPEWVRRVVSDIRSISQKYRRAVGILLDTQGPSIRTGDLPAKIPLAIGDRFTFTVRGRVPGAGKWTSVGYDGFVDDVQTGDTLIVDNGEMKMRILSKTVDSVECEVLTEGSIGSRRHINLPGVHVSLPALTDKDKEDVRLGLEVGVDYVALSFVRDPRDIEDLRAFLRQHPSVHQPQIVAKIEHQFAVNHFEAIAREADVIMVARGDLGIECPYEELPIIQRRIVKTCQRLGRPVIVATHMLESMIQNPLPTRAEITDVANAVFEQADAIMLSGETTVGRHPLACIEVMDTIARRIERSGGANYQENAELTSPRQKLVRSAVSLADDLKAAALLVFTRRGHMARYAAWMRPRHSEVQVFTDRWPTADGMTLLRGVAPRVVAFDAQHPDRTVDEAVLQLLKDGELSRGDTVVVVTNMASGERIVDGVKIRTLD